nr:hypothetical protein BaRGS_015462 [Batillaria attramentaria]
MSAQPFSKIWEKEEVPAQWKEGIVIKLPKERGPQGTAATTEGIMLCQCQAREAQTETSQPESARHKGSNGHAEERLGIQSFQHKNQPTFRIFNSNVK